MTEDDYPDQQPAAPAASPVNVVNACVVGITIAILMLCIFAAGKLSRDGNPPVKRVDAVVRIRGTEFLWKDVTVHVREKFAFIQTKDAADRGRSWAVVPLSNIEIVPRGVLTMNRPAPPAATAPAPSAPAGPPATPPTTSDAAPTASGASPGPASP